MKSKRCSLTLLSSALIVVLTAVGTAVSLTSRSVNLLTAYGLQNLKYFTVDSNLFLGLVCLTELLLAAARRAGRIAEIPAWIGTLQYIAAVAVALTFTVVMVFFGPAVGYAPLLREGNLYFHLLVPLLALISFCTLRRGRYIPLRDTALALIPSVLYGAYYTVTLLLYGAHFPSTDWYGFALGGIRGSVMSASGIFLLTWLLALLLRLAAGGTRRAAARS